MVPKKVLIAGLFHETHSFLEGRTLCEHFETRLGEDLLRVAGDVSPLAGVLEVAREEQWEIIPAVDMRAMPGPIVEDRALEVFWSAFRSSCESAGGKLDGILLVLHGAMVSESIDDVEGEILSRIRKLPGCATTPVCAVLDLHANVTPQMILGANAIVAYKENPHSDAKLAAMGGARLLARLMKTREHAVTIWEHPAIMWPPTGTATAAEPMRTLQGLAREIEQRNPEILAVNAFAGFAFSDMRETGVSFSATTIGRPEAAREELQKLSTVSWQSRELGNVLDPPLGVVLPKLSRHREGPIVLVEPSDNIGAGAPGSGTSLLRGLLEHSVGNAAVIINDPVAVASLSTKSVGDFLTLSFGGKGSPLYEGPVELNVKLISRSDGRFDIEDSQSHLASMLGAQIDMGPCAVVLHKGIRILLTSRKTPPFDLGQLRSQGIEPTELFAIGVKAAVAHRRAYDPIAKANYSVDTPGPCSSNLKSYPYRKVSRPIYPLDP